MFKHNPQYWIFAWCSLENEDATIHGVSINNAEWTRVPDGIAAVVDPIHGTSDSYPIFQHSKDDGTVIRMAYGEQTNGVYLVFVESELDAATVDPPSTIKSIKTTHWKYLEETQPYAKSVDFWPLFLISFGLGVLAAIALWRYFN